ncbi:MAG: oxidoreductase [Coprobacillaceae bacterium]
MKKVILITGVSSGIGKVTAKRLLSEGYIVYGASRKAEQAKDLEALGVHLITLDVTNEISCENCVKQVVDEQGKIDVLINNAGFGLYGSVEDIPLKDAKYEMDVNVFGLAKMTQLVIPHMRDKNKGTIINISSIAGKITTPMGTWYHTSKFAVEGFSNTLRLELKQFGIHVVLVEPGLIRTNFEEVANSCIEKYSGDGPYEDLGKAMAKTYVKAETKGSFFYGSDPNIIAKTISKAIHKNKPRTRYVAGHLGKLSLLARRYVSDKMYDRCALWLLANVKRLKK